MKVPIPSDMGIRLLALVIAVALWFVAASDTNTRPANLEERVVTANVRLEGVKAGYIPVTRAGTVEVRLRVPAGTGVPEQLDAYVDLSGRRVGEHRLPVKVNIPARLTVIGINPESVTVKLEKEITRSYPVELAIIGLPAGETVAAGLPEPTTVLLTGAETRVNRVHRVLAVVTYDPAAGTLPANVRPVDSVGTEVLDVVVKPRQVKVTLGQTELISAAEDNNPPGTLTPQPGAPGAATAQPQPTLATPKPVPVPKTTLPRQSATAVQSQVSDTE